MSEVPLYQKEGERSGASTKSGWKGLRKMDRLANKLGKGAASQIQFIGGGSTDKGFASSGPPGFWSSPLKALALHSCHSKVHLTDQRALWVHSPLFPRSAPQGTH